TVTVNQRQAPPLGPFRDLGVFRFITDQQAVVVVSNTGTDGHVIVDAVQFLTPEEIKQVQEDAKKQPVATNTPAKAALPPSEPSPNFQRKPVDEFSRLTPQQLDSLLERLLGGANPTPLVDDEVFLRRVSLDIVGRQPTVEEFECFTADTSPAKRSAAIDRLLASPDYGRNWGNYWSDVIG